MVWTVYILKCANGKYYVGCTSNLKNRLQAHLQKRVKYTRTRLPFDVVVTIEFWDRYLAYRFEKYLKTNKITISLSIVYSGLNQYLYQVKLNSFTFEI